MPISNTLAAKVLEWNFMAGDYETLLLMNDTKQTTMQDPVSADPGDQLRLPVYYHCGWDDPEWPTENARNTGIRINFPTGKSQQITTVAQLWADNVPAIDDTGTINVSSAERLVFENTAEWHHGSQVQNISVNLVEDGGDWDYGEVNIGDIACDCVDCYDNDGTVVFRAQVSEPSVIPPPTVDIKANGSDGPITIDYNTSASLSWTSTNATSCTASGDWSGSKATSGSEGTGSLTGSKTYTITCTGTGGTAYDSVTVNVFSQPTLYVDLQANPNSGTAPLNNVDLIATVSGTATGTINYKFDCTNNGTWDYTYNGISDNPKTVVDACNYLVVGTYTAKVYVERGSATPAQDTTNVYVSSVSTPTVDIKANGSDGPITIDYNTSATLTWTSTNATSCTASGDWSGSKATYGSEGTGNLTGSKTYTITCTGAGGTAYDSVTVNVNSVFNPNLSVAKTVRNATQGTGFSSYVSSNPSDQLEFRVEVSSTGSSTANNVKIRDIMPSQISYLGNLKINGYSSSGDIQSEINLGNLTPGTTKVITFDARIFSEGSFGYGTTTRVNNAYTWADTVSQRSDAATISIYRTTPTPTSPGLSIDKRVRNVTNGTGYKNSITADPGEDIEFQIKVSSIGTTTAYNVVVTDEMPSDIIYRGDLRVNGISHTGSITSGLNLGSMAAGTIKTITFDAEIASEDNFNYGTNILTNTARVNATSLSEVIDSVSLSVLRTQPLSTQFDVEKKVRNVSKGQSNWYEIVTAKPADKIAFQIVVSNGNDTAASDVIVKDGMPEKIAWYGNLKLDGEPIDGDIVDGIDIGDLEPGESKTITFEALLGQKNSFIFGTTGVINSALAYNTELSRTDTAKVNVQRAAVAGEVTEVPTGILNNVVMSLGITFLLTYCLLLVFFVYRKGFPKLNLASGIYSIESSVKQWYYSVNPFKGLERSERKLTETLKNNRGEEKEVR